jgi:hypothetical protein
MNQAIMDFIGRGGVQGDLASYMAASGTIDPNALRPYVDHRTGKSYITVFAGGDVGDPKNYQAVPIQTNATLRRDEWKRLDEAVLKISESRLGGIQDLITNGLTYDIGSGMGSTVLEWHDMSDAMEADLTMDGITRSVGDRPVFNTNYMPLPIIHSDYEINARVLAASRTKGEPLDTSAAERATRKVLERLEMMLFTDTTYAFGGGSIYSYLSEPNINTVALPLAWDNASKTGALILTDVLNMKQASIDAYHYGPWKLYVPTAYETVLDGDYDTVTPGTTIRERILKISGITGIQVVDTMPADTVVLTQMTSDVVRLVRGMGIQNVEWETEGKMVTKFKVMTIQVPQVRSDADGNSGVVVLS